MEGRASNWRKVLVDFESRLPSADYVAIDTELTGVDLEAVDKRSISLSFSAIRLLYELF